MYSRPVYTVARTIATTPTASTRSFRTSSYTTAPPRSTARKAPGRTPSIDSPVTTDATAIPVRKTRRKTPLTVTSAAVESKMERTEAEKPSPSEAVSVTTDVCRPPG
jgi:hypothetical protein